MFRASTAEDGGTTIGNAMTETIAVRTLTEAVTRTITAETAEPVRAVLSIFALAVTVAPNARSYVRNAPKNVRRVPMTGFAVNVACAGTV